MFWLGLNKLSAFLSLFLSPLPTFIVICPDFFLFLVLSYHLVPSPTGALSWQQSGASATTPHSHTLPRRFPVRWKCKSKQIVTWQRRQTHQRVDCRAETRVGICRANQIRDGEKEQSGILGNVNIRKQIRTKTGRLD